MTFNPAEARRRVARTDWSALAAELDEHGSAPTGPLLSPAECAGPAALYDEPELFRTTVDLARHRFGSGEYRYFTHDLPTPVAALRAALRSRLLTAARDWAARLDRAAPWPDSLEEWLDRCHDAGQDRSADPAQLRAGRLERPAPGRVRRTGLPAPGRDPPRRVRHGLHRR